MLPLEMFHFNQQRWLPSPKTSVQANVNGKKRMTSNFITVISCNLATLLIVLPITMIKATNSSVPILVKETNISQIVPTTMLTQANVSIGSNDLLQRLHELNRETHKRIMEAKQVNFEQDNRTSEQIDHSPPPSSSSSSSSSTVSEELLSTYCGSDRQPLHHNSLSGVIKSPLYPNLLSARNYSCVWRIITSYTNRPHTQLNVRFDDLLLPADSISYCNSHSQPLSIVNGRALCCARHYLQFDVESDEESVNRPLHQPHKRVCGVNVGATPLLVTFPISGTSLITVRFYSKFKSFQVGQSFAHTLHNHTTTITNNNNNNLIGNDSKHTNSEENHAVFGVRFHFAYSVASTEKQTNSLSKSHRSCGDDEFACENGRCISLRNRCDGTNHCFDGSDEHSCPSYSPCSMGGRFRCGNGRCILLRDVCSGRDDCGDGSDERGCISNSVITAGLVGALLSSLFMLLVGSCVWRLSTARMAALRHSAARLDDATAIATAVVTPMHPQPPPPFGVPSGVSSSLANGCHPDSHVYAYRNLQCNPNDVARYSDPPPAYSVAIGQSSSDLDCSLYPLEPPPVPVHCSSTVRTAGTLINSNISTEEQPFLCQLPSLAPVARRCRRSRRARAMRGLLPPPLPPSSSLPIPPPPPPPSSSSLDAQQIIISSSTPNCNNTAMLNHMQSSFNNSNNSNNSNNNNHHHLHHHQRQQQQLHHHHHQHHHHNTGPQPLVQSTLLPPIDPTFRLSLPISSSNPRSENNGNSNNNSCITSPSSDTVRTLPSSEPVSPDSCDKQSPEKDAVPNESSLLNITESEDNTTTTTSLASSNHRSDRSEPVDRIELDQLPPSPCPLDEHDKQPLLR